MEDKMRRFNLRLIEIPEGKNRDNWGEKREYFSITVSS